MSFLSLLPWVDMSKKQRVGYYEQNSVRDKWVLTNSLLPSRPQPLFQSEAKCKAIDMKIFFYSHVHKTHFHKKTGICTFFWTGIVYGFFLLIVTLRWHGILFPVDSRGFALKNNTDLTTKEREYMKEKYCKAKYRICV